MLLSILFETNMLIIIVLTLSVEYMGSSPGRVKPTSPLNMHHPGVMAKIDWRRIETMCPSGVTCLHAECCLSELALCHQVESFTKNVPKTMELFCLS
jgi:hypothetical protein